MSYSQGLLSKKGSLGVIWVAAYCFARLKKNQALTTDISSSVDEILLKELDVTTYRVLAYLLLGLTRIFSKKVEYLCDDCQDVIAKVNNFVVSEISKTVQRAPFDSITLPDSFELDAFDLEIVEDVSEDNMLPYEHITLKDHASSSRTREQDSVGKDSCEEFSAFRYTCLTDYAPAEDIILFESMENELDASTSHELNILKTSLEKHHGNNSSQEEWVNLDTIYGNDGEHANSINLSGKDQCHDREHIEVLVIAQPENGVQSEATTKKHENSRSAGGKDNQSDGDQTKVPHLEQSEKEMGQAINEDNNLINLQASMEKRLDHKFIQEACMDVEMVCGSEDERAELFKPSCEEDHTNSVRMNSMELFLSTDDNCHSMLEEDPESTVDATPHSKFLDASGATAPQFRVLDTPATKDRAHRSRRRKCCIDDVILISNNQIKQHIQDASDLVSKRRKAPRTALSAQISNLLNDFSAPILPCISSELSSLFRLEKSKILETADTVESSEQKSSTVGKSLEQIASVPETTVVIRSSEQMAIAPETPRGISLEKMAIAQESPMGGSLDKMAILPEELTGGRSLEQHAVAPETPVLPSREKRTFETPVSQLASYTDMIASYTDMIMQAHSFQDVEKEPSSSTDQEIDLNMEIEEPDSSEADKSEIDGLSERTRVVVKYLHRKFVDQKKRTENEAVNFNKLLEGRTRKESARLFYEMLVLKSKGYVDVKQDDTSGDIQVQKVPKWDQSCAVLFPQDDSYGDIQVRQVPKWN